MGASPLFSVSGPTFYNFALRLWLSVRGAERDQVSGRFWAMSYHPNQNILP